ncbi:MAG: sugar ABC transporter substrate-binding protein [Thermodesulfobacteriota bacterium]
MRKWLCLIMVAVAFAGFGQGFAAEKPYAGQELKISFIAGFPTNIGLKTLIPEFEKETGIRITIIETGYGVILEKNILDLSAQTGAYDVLHVESLWFPQYLPYLYPINEFMDDPKLFNAAEYDLEDLTSYTPLTLGAFTRDGKLLGLPHLAGIPLNWYRKDLLDKAGLQPPQDVDEYYAYAKKLTRDGVYGVALSASRSGLVDEWLSFFFAYGGAIRPRAEQFLKTTFDNPTALKALELYKRLFDECAPPESLTWEFGEVGSAMQRGVVAMMWNWSNGGSWYDDPEVSTVVGKVRANVPWPGRFGVNGLCIPQDAPNKEAAFEFLKWATSKDIMRRTTLAGGSTPCRISVLMDPQITKKNWWFEALRESGRWSTMYLEIPEWSSMDDALAIEFQKVLTTGLSPAKALRTASENAYKILEEAGYLE